MPSALLKFGDCCAPCPSPVVVNTPGPGGDTGAPGTNGADGVNAWTGLSTSFTVPETSSDAEAEVQDSTWIAPGQIVYLQFAGYFEVISKADGTHVTLRNTGYFGNVDPATVVPIGAELSPSGQRGIPGDINDLFTIHEAVRAASTADVTVAAPGAAIDGVALNPGDRVLLKDQTAPAENGLYIWNGAAVPMTRATDLDTDAEAIPGLFVWTLEGTDNIDSGFVLTTASPITLGTTGLTFQAFSGLVTVTAGNGMVKVGDTFHAIQSAAYTPGQVVFASGAATLALSAALSFAGSDATFGGLVTLNGDPASDLEAVTKQYADLIAGIHGAVPIGNGATGGSVTGLGLASAPACVLLTVETPAGGLTMAATLVGPATTDGFDFGLTGMTDSADYVLHYHLFL